MTARAKPLLLEESVLTSLRRITRAIDIYSKKVSAACDLTGPQLACMRQLDAVGPMTMSQLASVVSLSPATVSGILDRLELRQLVVRERQLDDKRRVLVRLSRGGQAALRGAPPLLQEQFSRRFRAMSARKQASLDRALREIVAMMEVEELDASPLLMAAGEPAHSTRS